MITLLTSSWSSSRSSLSLNEKLFRSTWGGTTEWQWWPCSPALLNTWWMLISGYHELFIIINIRTRTQNISYMNFSELEQGHKIFLICDLFSIRTRTWQIIFFSLTGSVNRTSQDRGMQGSQETPGDKMISGYSGSPTHLLPWHSDTCQLGSPNRAGQVSWDYIECQLYLWHKAWKRWIIEY